MSVPAEAVEAVRDAGLTYTSDSKPGISRQRKGDSFIYFDAKGNQIEDEKTLERIRKLAIPPAYENVWISTNAKGHLQATGKDARGRKQYRYHSGFRELRDTAKYDKMVAFGKALPRIHERLNQDLAKRNFPREKVLAVVVSLLEKSLIRVGNDQYAKENKHFGLTTLRNRHVKVEGAEVKFNFMGKSGVKHNISLHDRKLANAVKKLQELPGQDLFQFIDSDGNCHEISSGDVNRYLKDISEEDFTAKDFRTWAGTVLALTEFVGRDTPETKTKLKAEINEVVKSVARELGNTPSVCRKCYIHPAIIEGFTDGSLHKLKFRDGEAAEMALVRLLKSYSKK